MSYLRCSLLLAIFTLAAGAAPEPDSGRIPFTARELDQGYRELIVLARPHAGNRSDLEVAEARDGIRVRERFPRFRDLRVIELEAGDTVEAAIARLQATGRYEFVERDLIRHVAFEPSDPQFANGAQWGLRNLGLQGGIAKADIQAPAAWSIIREAPNVVVAVIDTGVNVNHQDLAGNIWQNPNPTFGDVNGARYINGIQNANPADDNGHGTHIAGIIGAVGNNGLTTAGVAWRVQIMAVKVFAANGAGSVSDIVRGVNYAVANGAKIINASYGESGSSRLMPSATERAAIEGARDAGVIFVAAAGNAELNLDVTRVYPASHRIENLITVGASTRRDELATFSNYGSTVDLFAPGSEILSLSHSSNSGTAIKSGTSMAAPFVTGALALLKARFPGETYRQSMNRLFRGVDRAPRFLGRAQTGGRLNLYRALTSGSNQPFNDAFVDRPRLVGANILLRASNEGATAEPGEPNHAGLTPRASLWWEWTSAIAGAVTIETSGSRQDTVLAVYTGPGGLTPSAPSQLVLVAENDNDPGSSDGSSRVTFAAQAGVDYQIAFSSRDAGGGLALLTLTTRPANDLFTGAETLIGPSVRINASNFNCSLEPGEPLVLGWPGGNSLWYRWTAPRTARFQLAATSHEFDPVLGVYTGEQVNALTLVAASDNSGTGSGNRGSLCSIDAIAGTTYAIKVDSRFAADSGHFVLNLVDSLWQASTGDHVTGAPAIGQDGTIYVGSLDRSLHAFTPQGALKWTAATGGFIDSCSPAVAPDGSVYFGSNDGRVYAYTATGTLKWIRNFGPSIPMSNSPAIGADGTIYIKGGDGFLYALEPAAGAILWQRNVNGPNTYASPSLAPDGTIYQGSDDGKLYAFNPDGSSKWIFTADNDIYTVPALDGAGNLYFGVLNTGKLFSVTPAGNLRWTYSGATLGSSSSPALSPDGLTVYFGGYDGKLHAVATASGEPRWTYDLGGEVRASSPAVDANGVIYLGAYDFRLHAINPDGTLNRTYDTGDWIRSSPAIFGHTLYVGSNDGKVYAFDIGTGVAAGPWSQFRHNVRRTSRAGALQPIAFSSAPQPQSVRTGDPLTLAVAATGDGPLAYEWRRDGVLIAGAVAASYTVGSATTADAGDYRVTVRGPLGTLTSAPVTVLVNSARSGRLVNLSVRARAGIGEQTLIVGFVVAGTGPKPLLMRGIGPSLEQYGITAPLADPQLHLLAGDALVASNNNWGGAAEVASLADRVGAFALDAGSKDAALRYAIPAGSSFLHVTGTNRTSGIALAELYDADPTDLLPTSASSRLVNISARAQVNAGQDILVAGFAISGDLPKRILIRAVGPGLAAFGINGVHPNPKLEVFRGQTRIHENDDWGGQDDLTTLFASVGAFELKDPASRDAVLVVTLEPGVYTAQITGVDGATGIALIEIYELP